MPRRKGSSEAVTTISSREFNQDTGRAKRASRRGPVVITDRGRPAHVLLSIEQYERLTGPNANIVELLEMPAAGRVSFDPPRVRIAYDTPDLSSRS